MRSNFRSYTVPLAVSALLTLQSSSQIVWAEAARPGTGSGASTSGLSSSRVDYLAPVANNGSNSSSLSGLSLSSGRNLVIDFGNSAVVNFASNLRIPSGASILAISTNPQVNSATIHAPNIFNSPGATISSMLPAAGLPGFENAIAGLNLSLIAKSNFVNHGTVSSAGNLNIFAGNQLVNSTSSGAAQAVMQAVGNVNLFSPYIVNQGLVQSGGNININNTAAFQSQLASVMNAANLASVIGNSLALYGVGGVFSASDSINIGGADFLQGSRFDLVGGNFLSKTMNLDMGQGVLNATLGNVTGVTNFSAAEVHFGAASDNLVLGNICITGDPTFFNTAGGITLGGNLSNLVVGDDLAILATGDVDLNNFDITTTDPNGNGRNLVIVAGANLVPSANAAPLPSALPPPPPANVGLTAGTIKVAGISGGGGNIKSTGGNSQLSTSAKAGTNFDAGNVTLIAYGGGIDGVDIFANGDGTGKNGGLTAIAGGQVLVTGNGINNLSFQANGGSGLSGSVELTAAAPNGTVTFGTTGKATGNFTVGALTGFGVAVNGINTNGGDIAMRGGGLSSTGLTSAAIAASAGRAGGTITLTSVGTVLSSDINVVGTIDASGAAGAAGVGNAAGQAGGAGGAISITQSGVGGPPVIALADVRSFGGDGGTGGNNAAGGKGGNAGKITISSSVGSIFALNINSFFGSPSAGGKGGLGGAGTTGGAGGAGGLGAAVSITSNAGGVFVGSINAAGSGGTGGNGFGIKIGGAGGNGQAINIKSTFAGSLIDVASMGGIVSAAGGTGGTGGNGISKGQSGGAGGAGGNSGTVSLSVTSTGFTKIGSVIATGGTGGLGGDGYSGFPGESAGNGGAGGNAGLSSSITLSSAAAHSVLGLDARGAAGGKGGKGGDSGANVGKGGAGGLGGLGANAGKISIGLVTATNLASGPIVLTGGFGGLGGDGGKGGPGGAGGAGGVGGNAGASTDFTLTGGNSMVFTNIPFVAAAVSVGGNPGGTGGAGGDGGAAVLAGQKGGAGGAGGNAGAGSPSANITISTANGLSMTDFQAAGSGGGGGGKGGKGGLGLANTAGGAGGVGGDGVEGLDGGQVTLSSTKGGKVSVNPNDFTTSSNAAGGFSGGSGSGGDGGDGSVGGAGGNTGHGADGGNAGSLTISTSGDVELLRLFMSGGFGGITGNGGKGGKGTVGAGGAGGSVLSPGNGGAGGVLTISVPQTKVMQTISLRSINLDGGPAPAGAFIGGGFAGDGGDGATTGGAGGQNGSSLVPNAIAGAPGTTNNTSSVGTPGQAGSLTIAAPGALVAFLGQPLAAPFPENPTVSVSGGVTTSFGPPPSLGGGNGGKGGTGNGGAGGSVAAFPTVASPMLNGGIISIKANDIQIQSDKQGFAILRSDGGGYFVGAVAGKGGDGKSGGAGGKMPAFASAAAAGKGGTINFNSKLGFANDGVIQALGGSVNFSLASGAGGNALVSGGSGGSSGLVGSTPAAGAGGIFTLASGALGVSNTGALSVNGGNVVVSTFSGDGGLGNGGGNSFGGSSGSLGSLGKAGAGGNITLNVGAGGATGKGILAADGGGVQWLATVGKGGDAGPTGTGAGGSSGSVGQTGNGGAGGIVKVTMGVNAGFGLLVTANGGVALNSGATVGAGGSNAGNLGNGGKSGSIGSTGSGGAGGTINISGGTGSQIDIISLKANGANAGSFLTGKSIGDGGSGANGGEGGKLANAGVGGKGGTVILSADKISIPAGTTLAANGGDGGFQGLPGAGGSGTVNGGNAGNAGNAGKGGDGGSVTITAKTSGSDMTNLEISAFGGTGGDIQSTANGGQNGKVASSNSGGNGGSTGKTGDGGKGGKITINGPGSIAASTLTVGKLTLNGGSAGSISQNLGNGGNGVVKGGNGGSFGGLGNSGAGGEISIQSAKTDITQAGLWNADGAQLILAQGTNIGGNGGTGKTGGAGGSIGAGGNAGKGGSLKLNANSLQVQAAKAFDISANGGAIAAFTSDAGRGGDGVGATANAGAGGNVGSLGTAGGGGSIMLTLANGVQLDKSSIVQANGGSITGGLLILNGGDGGNSMASNGFNGGKGGSVGNGPSAGKGGIITINTGCACAFGGTSTIPDVNAFGGNHLAYVPISGNGGDGKGNGKGGDGGSIGTAGNAGGGGSITITSTTGHIDMTGGLGVFFRVNAKGGAGPLFQPASGVGGQGEILGVGGKSIGGNSGNIGNNGNGGTGGNISINSSAGGNLLLNAFLAASADGGAAGAFVNPGISNTGFGGNGDAKGGNSGSVGNGGKAGNAGNITISTSGGLGAGELSANGGLQAAYSAVSGDAGQAKTAGAGGNSGNVGGGELAGKGGKITINSGDTSFLAFGLGNVRATGGDITGGSFFGKSGVGGNGTTNGGNAGKVGNESRGGDGGTISITSSGPVDIALADVRGGKQTGAFNYKGQGGKGGQGGTLGGNGGSVGSSSSGGNGGGITITAKGDITFAGAIVTAGGSANISDGIGGDGGTSGTKGGAAGSVAVAGSGGAGGTITLKAATVITLPGTINSSGGFGGNQNGKGGIGTTGGKGGSVGNGGNGASGGNVTISVPNVQAGINAALGAAGAYTGTAGAGTPPGVNGKAGNPGAKNGTVKVTLETDDSDSGLSDIENYKKRIKQWKRQVAGTGAVKLQIIASSSASPSVSENFWVRHSNEASFSRAVVNYAYDDLTAGDEAEVLDPVAYVQSVAPLQVAEELRTQSPALAILTDSAISKSTLAKIEGASFEETSGGRIEMVSGTVLLAPTESAIDLSTPAGTVSVAAGAKALVQVKGGYTAVLDLHDHKQGEVLIRSGKTQIGSVMGQSLVLGPDSGKDLASINPLAEVSLRDTKSRLINDGSQRLFESEFSIMSALLNHSSLKTLRQSQEKEHKKHLEQFMKNAVVLNHVTAGHGIYKMR